MPRLGKDRAGLLCSAPDRDDVVATGYGRNERIIAERAEILSEAFEVVVGQRLAGKGNNVVGKPCCADVGDGLGIQRLAQVYACYAGTAGFTTSGDRQGHGVSSSDELITAQLTR